MIKQLRTFLDEHNIRYDTVKCTPTDTVEQLVNSLNIPEKGIAKTVVVRSDGKFTMLVEPVSVKTDLNRWKELLSCETLELATEDELVKLFGNLEKDSIPAFGNLFNMEVFLDDNLSLGKEIAFNAGKSTELVKLAYEDFAKWVKPKLFHIH